MKRVVRLLGWFGLIFVGVFYGHTLWARYVEGNSSEIYKARPVPAQQPETPSTDVAALQQQVKDQAQRLRKLEQAADMSRNVSRNAARNVGLIVGEYIWTDVSRLRPLRYVGVDEDGNYLRDDDGRERVSFEGKGPVVVREFQGTGFLINSRYMLTSDFILAPWFADPLLDQAENPERFPSFRAIHAYFPESEEPISLKIDHVEESGDAVICILDHEAKYVGNLGITSTATVQDGEPVVLLAYPGGVELLTSRVPNKLLEDLYKSGRPTVDQTAKWLAKNRFIEPLAMESRVNGHKEDRIFFEMTNAGGSTGGPVLNSRGQAVAMHLATHNSLPSFNVATELAPIASWIKENVSR